MAFRATIVGLGVIGSSIGLALRAAGASGEIVGHDKDAAAARQAHKDGAVDRTDWNLIAACDGADLIIVSIPLSAIRDTFSAIARDVKPGCVVTDTAALKTPVLQWAREYLPPSVHYIGGHPILRRDMPRPVAPAADLFDGCLYCLTPEATTEPEALQTASNLTEAVGAVPYYLDATEHDSIIAVVAQLPLLMGIALQHTAGGSASSREVHRLASVDFAAATQFLAGDASALAEWCTLNAANLSRWLDLHIEQLTQLRDGLANGDQSVVRGTIAKAKELYEQWIRPPPTGSEVDYDAFSPSRMMFGDLFRPREPNP